ncbi:hypothetical protein BH11ACT3_BH11ACT3_10090 [soil metagenome]
MATQVSPSDPFALPGGVAPTDGEGAATLSAVASGDREAFAKLYDELATETYGLCRRFAATQPTAEVAQSEIWLFVWRHAASLAANGASPRVTVLSVALAMLNRMTPAAR